MDDFNLCSVAPGDVVANVVSVDVDTVCADASRVVFDRKIKYT